MAQLRKTVEKLQETHSQSLSSTTAAKNKALKQRIGNLIDETRSSVKDVKQKLTNMDEKTKKMKEDQANAGTAEARIREQQHANLMREFVEVLKAYQSIQDTFKKDSEDRMVRQIKIAKADATDEEIDELIQKQDVSVFRTVLTGSQKSTVEAVYAEGIYIGVIFIFC